MSLPIIISSVATNTPDTLEKVVVDGRKSSFFSFIFRDKLNRIYLTLIIGASFLSFLLFKWIYPKPDFFSDSYSYIFAASAGLDANIWPIGYSKFLAVLHAITHSDTVLIWLQYTLYQITAIYFYYSLLYFFKVKKETKIFLSLCLFVNPLFFYLANYVTSDILFCSLSLVWFTQLLWMLHKPNPYHLLTQAVLLFFAFVVRYNAMYYPFAAALLILLAKYRWWEKLAGIILPWLLIIPFIVHSRAAAKELTGTAQFPLLSGWQWANNALYMYEHISVDNASLPTLETRELNGIAKKFFQTTPYAQRDLPNYVANFFIRQPNAPLKKYLTNHYQFHDDMEQVIAWGKVSPVFGEFGKTLIKQHPFFFARYYMLINTKNYFLPPLEKLIVYNLGQKNTWPMAVSWFDWDSSEVSSKLRPDFQGVLLVLYPSLFLVLNLYFIYLISSLFANMPFSENGEFLFKTIILASVFLLLNFCFSIFANIIVIRYQIFPMVLFFCISLVLADFITRLKSTYPPKPVNAMKS